MIADRVRGIWCRSSGAMTCPPTNDFFALGGQSVIMAGIQRAFITELGCRGSDRPDVSEPDGGVNFHLHRIRGLGDPLSCAGCPAGGTCFFRHFEWIASYSYSAADCLCRGSARARVCRSGVLKTGERGAHVDVIVIGADVAGSPGHAVRPAGYLRSAPGEGRAFRKNTLSDAHTSISPGGAARPWGLAHRAPMTITSYMAPLSHGFSELRCRQTRARAEPRQRQSAAEYEYDAIHSK